MNLYLVLDDSDTGSSYEDSRGRQVESKGFYVRGFATDAPGYPNYVCSLKRALGREADSSAVYKDRQKLLKIKRVL